MKMVRYEGRKWIDARDPLGSIYEDVELSRCEFRGCALGSLARYPSQRTIVRRVRATSCAVEGWLVGPALFEDVSINNLRTLGGDIWVAGAIYKHVVLSGKIGNITLAHWRWGPVEQTEEISASEAAFAADAVKFYSSIDWALDISRAEFRYLDWRLDMPTHLVRRDPETQIVLKRERLLDGAWRKLPLDSLVSIALSNFMDFVPSQETIIAASKASKSFKDELASIELLRKEGIAEPD